MENVESAGVPKQALRPGIDTFGVEQPLRILFVGAGAIGSFYASRIHHPGKNVHVSLVCRSNYAIVSKKGIALETHDFGNYTLVPSATFPSISAAASEASASNIVWDYVVLTTKALPDLVNEAELIRPLIEINGESDGRTCIVLIQNGVGIEAPFRKQFPRNPLVSGVTAVSAEQIQDGVVRQNRWTRVSLGPYTDGIGGQNEKFEELTSRGQKSTEEFCALLRVLGRVRDAESHNEIELQQIRWHKLCINAAMNPTSILSGGRYPADMVSDLELRAHLEAIMNEVREAAAVVLGRPFPDGLAKPERILNSVKRNAGGRPSMWVDWLNHKPMELEVILGIPVRMAAQAGYQMHRVNVSYILLKSAQRIKQERKARN